MNDDEYKIVRETVYNSDGSKIHFDNLCDDYGLSIRTVITICDENDNIIGDKITLLGM